MIRPGPILAAVLLWLAPCLVAADTATVTSPGGVLGVAFSLDPDGRPQYAVTRRGVPVIADSRLGFLLTDAPKLERGFRLLGVDRREADSTWEQPWGERRFVRDHYREMRVRLADAAASGRRMNIVFRAFDDGVGFRYEFPDQPGLPLVNITDELTEFTVAAPATAWWIPAGEWNRYEYLYRRTPLAEIGQAHTPLAVRTDAGLHLALHEAAFGAGTGRRHDRLPAPGPACLPRPLPQRSS